MSTNNWADEGRCMKHTGATEVPTDCTICNRIRIERTIVLELVECLLRNSYALMVDSEEGPLTAYTTNIKEILESVDACDDIYLNATPLNGGNPYESSMGWIRLVYGNDGYDIITDYLMWLEPILGPIIALADSIEDGTVVV